MAAWDFSAPPATPTASDSHMEVDSTSDGHGYADISSRYFSNMCLRSLKLTATCGIFRVILAFCSSSTPGALLPAVLTAAKQLLASEVGLKEVYFNEIISNEAHSILVCSILAPSTRFGFYSQVGNELYKQWRCFGWKRFVCTPWILLHLKCYTFQVRFFSRGWWCIFGIVESIFGASRIHGSFTGEIYKYLRCSSAQLSYTTERRSECCFSWCVWKPGEKRNWWVILAPRRSGSKTPRLRSNITYFGHST